MGFRLRARLAIRGRVGAPKLGLFELGTHRVAHIPNCLVHHPLINHVASVVRRALAETRMTSYSDQAHMGVARYLQVVVERSSQSAQVVLVGNCATAEPFTATFELIRERLGSDLHSLWFNSHCDASNSVLGARFKHLYGPASVVERFGGAALHYPPGAFGQSNLEIAQSIIDYVRGEIPFGACVAECYSGVGAVGLSVLDRSGEIMLNEISAHSLQGLDLGLAELSPADRAKVTVIPGTAAAALEAVVGSQVIIADPPRRGLEAEFTRRLSENPPQRFVYISCGLESFLDDTRRLVSQGKLRLSALTAFNMIPFTGHVETVARFERV